MKNIRTFIATLASIILFASCQKDTDFGLVTPLNNGTSTTASTSQVKTYTEDVKSTSLGNSSVTYNLSYDANGRLTSMISSTSTGDKFVYQYNTNNYTMDIYTSNALSIHETFFLNSLSLVDSTLQYNDTQDTTTEKYLYNSAKQLVKLKEYDYSASGATLSNIHDYTYDGNGNVITETDLNGVITYDYYANLVNNLSIGQPYFAVNKNLVKTTTYKESGTTITFSHTYTFDGNNRLTTGKITGSEGSVFTRTYTY